MITSLVLAVEAAQAASYYVDSTSGADSNSGTSSAAPWKSLSKVNGIAFQAGDLVNFKRGSVWTGTTLVVDSSGTSSNPVTYQAYGTGNRPEIAAPSGQYQESITVTGDWNVVKGFLLRDGHEAGIDVTAGADHNTIRDNEVRNAGIGVVVRGQFNLITENHVHDLKMIVNTQGGDDDYGATCFWLYAANNEVSYNRGVNCVAASYDYGYDGGFVEVYNQGDNTYVHHNYAENTDGFFELGAGGSGGSANNVRVAYNVIYKPNGGLCLHSGGSFGISIANFKFENNTLVNTGNRGYRIFDCRSDFSALQVRNNIFYSNLQIANSGNFTHANNLYYMVNMINGSGVGYSLGSGEKTGNPLFVSVGVGDFLLQVSSPAIDAGLNLGYTGDYEDKPVPAGSAPDIGAYEFGKGSTLPPPAAPTGLRIK